MGLVEYGLEDKYSRLRDEKRISRMYSWGCIHKRRSLTSWVKLRESHCAVLETEVYCIEMVALGSKL